MKEVIPVSPCPWCRELPAFVMDRNRSTWTPMLKCNSQECYVNPHSRHVSIRKNQKYRWEYVGAKIRRMIGRWNTNNPYRATSGMEFDFHAIAEEERKRDGVTLEQIRGGPGDVFR